MSKKRGKISLFLQYAVVRLLFALVLVIPNWIVPFLCNLLGYVFSLFVAKRRNIAIANITKALSISHQEAEIIAKKSFASFVMTFFEAVKLRYQLKSKDDLQIFLKMSPNVKELFDKAQKNHSQSNGCIFLSPHLGNWEVLPFAGSAAGIDIVAIVRPIDNPYIESFLYKNRTATGQGIISRKNAFFTLIETLKNGKSVGMLPDQSTMKGIVVNFFDRPASTTPLPALLAIKTNKPIIVTACCRTSFMQFEGYISNPIYADTKADTKVEVFRIMTLVNKYMQEAILKYPEQYLWMHNRWKVYKNKKVFLDKFK